MTRNDLKYHQGYIAKKETPDEDEDTTASLLLALTLLFTAIVAVVLLFVAFEPEIRGIFRVN